VCIEKVVAKFCTVNFAITESHKPKVRLAWR